MCRIRASLLRPKSAVLGSKSGGSGVESGDQIASRAKNPISAKAYTKRTPLSHDATEVSHRVASRASRKFAVVLRKSLERAARSRPGDRLRWFPAPSSGVGAERDESGAPNFLPSGSAARRWAGGGRQLRSFRKIPGTQRNGRGPGLAPNRHEIYSVLFPMSKDFLAHPVASPTPPWRSKPSVAARVPGSRSILHIFLYTGIGKHGEFRP
jgi:hypothetical protein